jgi:hypothetical protein
MKSTEVSVFRGTNTVVAMSKISLPRKVLAVTTITSGGSWRNQRLHKLAPFVRRKASSMSVNAMFRQPQNKKPVIRGVEAGWRHRTEVVDLAAVTAQAIVGMAAKAPSDKAFGETHPGDLP